MNPVASTTLQPSDLSFSAVASVMDDPSGFQRANLNLFISRAAGVVKPDDAALQRCHKTEYCPVLCGVRAARTAECDRAEAGRGRNRVGGRRRRFGWNGAA